jgi:prepilin-type N-terminal cleavage/methylation domain-containing protein
MINSFRPFVLSRRLKHLSSKAQSFRSFTKTRQPSLNRGFTIIELIVVIVVIAILATIVIVAYNGIQQRARVVSLQNDMTGAVTTLGIANVNTGVYPADLNSASLKASPGTTYQYASTGSTYCVTGTNSGVAYMISSTNTTPTVGVCPGDNAPGTVVNNGVVTTIAGSGTVGYNDGNGISAQFNQPAGIAVDSSGNIYVGDLGIRKITNSGVVSHLAGSLYGGYGYADGTGASALFSGADFPAVGASGDIYVVDTNNNAIRKVTSAGVVTTFAGTTGYGYAEGPGASALFRNPVGIAIDASGNLYIGDHNNASIREVTSSAFVSTFAGAVPVAYSYADGTGTSARFNGPEGIAIDSAGNLYMADYNNNDIRKITPAAVVTTLAGSGAAGYADGTGIRAIFNNPTGVAVDSSGTVYVADSGNNRIRKITPAGVVTTLAGSGAAGYADGTGTSAIFNKPYGIAVDASGALYVTDFNNYRVREIQ